MELKRGSFTGPVESTSEIVPEATGLGSDQLTGDVLIDLGTAIREYNAKGEIASEFGQGTIGLGEGVAVNEAGGDVYVSDEAGKHIAAFGRLITIPDVTACAAENVTATSARLTGTVNQTKRARHHCSVRLSAVYGQSAAGTPSPVSGASPADVTADLSGLEPNTTYHCRLTATNSEGTGEGEDATFTTQPTLPMVKEQSARTVGPGVALIYATINPENSGNTTYQVVYGTTETYGSSVPLDGGVELGSFDSDHRITQTVSGLRPDTTYHYAVVATNPQGSTASSDAIFKTPPATPPVVGGEAAGEITQNGVTLSGTVDPEGVQSAYEFDIGTDTSYGTRISGEAGQGITAETVDLRLQGLAAGATYHFRLVATNKWGTTYGTDQTFTTPTVPTADLTAPPTPPLIATPAFSVPRSSPSTVIPKTTKPKKKKKTRSEANRKSRHGGLGRCPSSEPYPPTRLTRGAVCGQ